jgi:hypothetical protein
MKNIVFSTMLLLSTLFSDSNAYGKNFGIENFWQEMDVAMKNMRASFEQTSSIIDTTFQESTDSKNKKLHPIKTSMIDSVNINQDDNYVIIKITLSTNAATPENFSIRTHESNLDGSMKVSEYIITFTVNQNGRMFGLETKFEQSKNKNKTEKESQHSFSSIISNTSSWQTLPSRVINLENTKADYDDTLKILTLNLPKQEDPRKSWKQIPVTEIKTQSAQTQKSSKKTNQFKQKELIG